ncbi:MAG: DUF4982 domain-containing protein [Prevotella sp.]|nr:DUF4982 domain-containing protein [Prevotella sp.]
MLLTVIAFLCHSNATYAQVSFGHATPFNGDWRFALVGTDIHDTDGKSIAAEAPAYDDSRWRRLQLPHDWSVEHPMSPHLFSCTGYLPGGVGWYRKHFSLQEGSTADTQWFVYFEGIYNRAEVFLNGHLLGMRPNGYASVLYDMTPWLNKEGDNVFAVRVDHSRQADSRWYTGSGIYRPVWLVKSGPVHLAQWGSAWRLKQLSRGTATVEVDVETTTAEGYGKASPSLKAQVTIYDAQHRQVAQKQATIGNQERQTLQLKISQPQLWNIGNGYLYTVETRLLDVGNGDVVDSSIMRMGLRTLHFDPDKGFFLNGNNMKVKGVCLHHDAGVLGAVVPRDVWERRLVNLQAIGVNAIRMSHNPQAPVVYDLSDSLGLLVMDEASDEWEFPKRKWLEGWNRGTPGFEGSYDFFEEWIDRDVADMVRRDRNHPCIFLWSIGNEVDYPNDPYSHPVLDGSSITQPMYGGYKPEQPDAQRIGRIAERLTKVVKQIDTSRPTTGALAGVVMSNETTYPQVVDVVGYNYTESRYDEDHRTYPTRVIYGSENRHDLEAWRAVEQHDFIFGQFLWTGIDYLGESGAWPARGSSAGLLDLKGERKPQGWWRASLWSEKPVCYIGTYPAMGNGRGRQSGRRDPGVSIYAQDTWNYRKGQTIRVVCMTNQGKARLMLNGEEVGPSKEKDQSSGAIWWDIPYHPGVLEAEALDSQGNVVASYKIETTGRPAALKMTTDKAVLAGRGRVAHVIIEVTDMEGKTVPLSDNEISVRVTGGGRLLGLEGGDMSDTSNLRDWRQRVVRGRLLAYVEATRDEGTITVRAESPMLEEQELTIKIKE